jgi:BolA protein
MNRKKRIETTINTSFFGWDVKIKDNSSQHIGHNNFDGSQESHFILILKGNNANNESRLAIHKKINKLLEDEFLNGLHALEIKIII